MPTYTFNCAKCEEIVEVVMSMTSKDKPDCPKCFTPMDRIIVAANPFVLKGEGWYSNESKGKYHG